MINVAVVGGGIAGLYTAWRLRQLRPDVNVTIYEAGSRVGGRIDTAEFAIRRNGSDQLTRMRAEMGDAIPALPQNAAMAVRRAGHPDNGG